MFCDRISSIPYMNNDTQKVAAIVVTFNRKDLLPQCLEGIFTQTRKVDHIFLIDNASTDGTVEVVQELYKNNHAITYVRLTENTGSAGGFHEGVKAAYEWGADWIWFLDDDVSPRLDCLEIMLTYEHISQCIHPHKRDSEGKDFIWESVFSPATVSATFLDNLSFKNGKDFTFVNMGCFEGMLIHRDIVKKIGFPDKSFFIAGDDVLYGFFASFYTNVIYVKDAMLDKLVPFNRISSPIFLYYAVRNQFLIRNRIKEIGLYNKRLFRLYLFSFVLYSVSKQTIRNKSLKTPVYIMQGLIDGMRGKFFKKS